MARDASSGFGRAEAAVAGSPAFDRFEWLRAMPSWALSAFIHLILVVLLIHAVRETGMRPRPGEHTTTVWVPPPKEPVPRTERRPNPALPRDEKYVPGLPALPPVKDPDVIPPGKEDGTEEGIQKGLPENRGDLNVMPELLRLDASYTPIGPGGPSSGPIGIPDGVDNAAGKGPLAGGGTEDAVYAALHWLRRHQSPEGAWRCRDFVQMCKIPCRSESTDAHDGRGFPEHDIGVTGLALMAFTGAGYTHRQRSSSELAVCADRAVRYLRGTQVESPDPAVHGRFGPGTGEQWIYDHAIATLALTEVLAVTNDVIGLKRPVEDAVRLCLRARNPGFAWRYGIQPGDNDSSVTGWMVLALKMAKAADLDIPDAEIDAALQGALAWFDRATSVSGRTGYIAPADEGSRLNRVHPEPYPYSKELSSMTAVSVVSRLFAGGSRSDPVLRGGVKLLLSQPPRWQPARGRVLSTINFYYWYYATYALHIHGGKEWTSWEQAIARALFDSQRHGEGLDEDGSWDPVDEWGPAGGRVYATAMGALTLEVYRRARGGRGAGR